MAIGGLWIAAAAALGCGDPLEQAGSGTTPASGSGSGDDGSPGPGSDPAGPMDATASADQGVDVSTGEPPPGGSSTGDEPATTEGPSTTDTTGGGGPCHGDGDCEARPRTPHCDLDSGQCEECTESSHCDGRPCDPETHTCVQCLDSRQCPSSDPVCDPAAHTCGPCRGPDDCDVGTCIDGECTTYGQQCGGSDECDEDAGEACCTVSQCGGICLVPCPGGDGSLCPDGTGCNHNQCFPLCANTDADCVDYYDLTCFHSMFCET